MLDAHQLLWTQIAAGVCLLNFAGLLIRLVRLRGATRNAGNWDKVEGVIIASEVAQPASHLSDDEMKALGGSDASAVAHALAQKGDMMVWQYNVHRGPNGDMQQAPTAKIGLLAGASLRVEPYTTPYAIVPHQ